MKRVKRKETIGNGRQYFTRSKKRQEEAAADEKDLISSLPLDLKLQILAKLPPKSIAKFISVSKLWSSIVRGKDLTELFISRSSTRPCFLFILRGRNIVEFHSYSQEEPVSRHHRHVKSITPKTICSHLRSPIRGLICGQEIDKNVSKVICNPSTGQCVTLPRVKARIRRPNDDILHFLGYDPVNDQYKVLCMMTQEVPRPPRRVISEKHQVFTLGARERAWRMIECKHPHFPATKELCRDGVVYYGAWYNSHHKGSLIVSFNVRSEDFGVIKLPEGVRIRQIHTELVDYHGKIALVDLSYTGNVDLWVLQDVKKPEWSKISFLLPDIAGDNIFRYRGVISTGEIIFAPYQYTIPFFLLYYDLEGNNARRVDIEGVRDSGDGGPIRVFLNHVENPMFLQKEV